MSDQPTLTSPSISDVLPSTTMPKVLTPQNRELECSVEGCDFKTTSEAGLKRHVTRTHGPKKKNRPRNVKKKVVLTQASADEREKLTKVWGDKSGTQILCMDTQGDWWVAEKLVV